MMARQASPTRLTAACIFLPLRVNDSSSAVMYPLTYCSYGGARETNHGWSVVHFFPKRQAGISFAKTHHRRPQRTSRETSYVYLSLAASLGPNANRHHNRKPIAVSKP